MNFSGYLRWNKTERCNSDFPAHSFNVLSAVKNVTCSSASCRASYSLDLRVFFVMIVLEQIRRTWVSGNPKVAATFVTFMNEGAVRAGWTVRYRSKRIASCYALVRGCGVFLTIAFCTIWLHVIIGRMCCILTSESSQCWSSTNL